MALVRVVVPLVAALVGLLVACKADTSSDAGPADDCQQSICPAPAMGRVYQRCTQNGGASCSYVTSDGQIFACTSCTDCASAMTLVATFCARPGDVPDAGSVDSGQDATMPGDAMADTIDEALIDATPEAARDADTDATD